MTTPIETIVRTLNAGYRWGQPEELATILITALDEDGWAIVPKVPTQEMIAAANRNNHPRDEETWAAMLAAVPKP